MDKIVTSGESNCYVTLTESNECAVKFDRTYRMFAVNNTSENEAIMSLSPNKSRTDDGVRIIPAGESRTLTTSGIDSDTVYINGNGSVEVAALNGNSVNPFFKGSSGGGGGGSSYIPNSEKGAAGGVATLDISGKVPAGQLPSYVDDVIDGYYYESSFYADSEHTQLIVGETGKIYNDVSTNISYRWNGTGYIAMGVQNAVTYTSQALTTEQKTQARENIGAAASDDIPTDAVKYTAQTLTDAQKTQARTNIGAGTSNFSGNYDDLDNAPDMTFIQPEISDMVDSGLGWRAQQAYYTDTAGNPQYYAQCLSYSDAYNGGYSLKINNGPSICAFIRDPNLIWGIYLLSTVESAAVINYAESRTSPVETISPVASNSWYIAGQIIDIGDYAPGKKRNYPDIVLPSDSTFRNADFGTDAATRAEAVRIILEAAHAIPPTSFNVPTVECTEQRYANAVKYTAQTLTDAQKLQARTNIGVAQPDWRQYNSSENDYIKNKPPLLAVYPGTSGSFTGGTGMINMNEATKQNSIAYGYAVSAKGDYSAAFGYFLQALHDYEIAFGKFNVSNADTAFSIGDGTGTGATPNHNLMELKTDGTLLLNGNAVKTESNDESVKYTTQTLTAAQKTQARTNIGAAAAIDYSTTEQDTGVKWVDGKPIFQKTYAFNPPVAGVSVNYIDLVDVSGLNIDTLIYMSGIERDLTYNNIATVETHSNNGENLFLTADKSTIKYMSSLAMEFLTLRYTRAIFITKQPEDVTVEAGTKFTMSVEAIGEGLTYQWQYMRPTETTWNDFTEATSNALNRTATINWDGWTVHCVITDTNSRTAISDEATITIAPSDGQKYIPDDEKTG